MDKAKILRMCNEIEMIMCEIYNTGNMMQNSDYEAVDKRLKSIAEEITAPPKTNGDKIRAMTDEELAEFLLESRSRCKLCKKHDEICEGSYHECWNGIDDWLKEVDEDAGTDD